MWYITKQKMIKILIIILIIIIINLNITKIFKIIIIPSLIYLFVTIINIDINNYTKYISYYNSLHFNNFKISLKLSIKLIDLTSVFLVLLIFTLVVIFSVSYLKHDNNVSQFIILFFLFCVSMIGVIIFDNVLLLLLS